MRSDDEKRILGLWPKYEDGSYVRLGDSYIDTDGDENEVMAIEFNDRCADLIGVEGCHTGFEPFERVKRPAPKVLDADGVEVHLGDTVYESNGQSGIVIAVHPSTRCVDLRQEGCVACAMDAKRLTHTRPDSWERLEEDATMSPWSYCDRYGLVVDRSDGEFAPTNETFALDLIRRAKALSEGGGMR